MLCSVNILLKIKRNWQLVKVHVKTGALTTKSSLSGYVTTRDDHWLIFSIIMINNFTGDSSEMKQIEDQIVLRLAEFSLE
ncbi:D-alanyl-D-alanine carboxypeptidase [Caldalkalibacillus uzonensis]|uniref:D-alanyl-D-alanine carboxypeptidase n=1 Tax=Caldalkalibacillus uzonensis TaxID=353224 RepID=A0ABU0CLU7_9BACI|nr:D-alanyl-D-alanine carboxypeptidase [Caldalkalibacillus uzonensis]MDQ0337385.1 D-alanyl-D-alanine carboxypeptidase [Caldalkalibacillus uzonensis]